MCGLVLLSKISTELESVAPILFGATAAMVESAASETSVVEVVLVAVLASVTLLSLVATYSL